MSLGNEYLKSTEQSKETEIKVNRLIPTRKKAMSTLGPISREGSFYIVFLQKGEAILFISFSSFYFLFTLHFPFDILEYAFPHVAITNECYLTTYLFHYLPECHPRIKFCLVSLLHYYTSCDGIMNNIKNVKMTYSFE